MDSQPIIRDLVLANVLGPTSRETCVQLVESDKRPFDHVIINTQNDRVSDPQDLVSLARQIETCDAFVRANVSNRLQVIVNQVNFLRQETQRILIKARRDDELNHSACNLVRRAGQIYYYYERKNGQKYLSIMHPQDWLTTVKNDGCPHQFLGAYKLEYDNSWTRQATDFDDGLDDPLDELKQKMIDLQQNRKMIEFLIKS
ncbi:unnamed protein product [Rotaria magnacalcarata]|uniref:Uncharacterized protein n=1 Tax=Rotaria magnacalcarata TaxID=392030 RepID=A0A816PT84_9BILA|nr:unnamed protein product [Rotaria magnacalcarata]CAF1402453.1 unnamed protein product [Rotaria magnacalcarata]CAF1968221.1 unnamed protein product [Rotaria magnacalcarata]CAF2052841.1 unnamed protein product [Rotaria magnacalcarata]CAF2171859.1 unnamed protein product [Rotaria magnacalcarata]